ncbi:DUF4241 domain-containing protein [Candidatus Woesearchaeota archaeon]|nr:DUF4241 domain-containing protein [Candidatus Woesearchaeota archaeon]
MAKEDRIRLGVVGVDSGQLMIVDPGYLGDWKDDDFVSTETFRDTETGKEIKRPSNWQKEYRDGMTYNEAMEKGLIESVPGEKSGEFSYNGVCQNTIDAEYKKADEGQINYKLGHAGLAVAFRSGLGDGCYEVWGTVKDLDGWGRRITKVEIILIDEESDRHKALTTHMLGQLLTNIYYYEGDDGKIVYDEDSIREDFEKSLKQFLKKKGSK